MANDEFNFDGFEDVEKKSFEPMEPGEYSAEITKVGYSRTGGVSKNKPVVQWEFTINEGPSMNRKIWHTDHLFKKDGTPNSYGKHFLLNDYIRPILGDASNFKTEDELIALVDSIQTDSNVKLNVTINEYNGKTRNEATVVPGAVSESDVPF